MSQNNEFAPKVTSGVDVIDRAWGGLFRGGSYLVYGRVSNGRGLLALAFEQAGVALGERSMLVSNSRERDLLIQSTAIGFNVATAHDAQLFRHIQTRDLTPSDPQGPSARIEHLTELILEFKPARLVVSDLVSLLNIGRELNLGDFKRQFVTLLEQIEPLETTALFTLPDPANAPAQRLAEFIMSHCAGAVHVGPRERDSEGYKLTLLPQIGHVTRRTVVSWPLHDMVARFENVEASYRRLIEERSDARLRLEGKRPEVSIDDESNSAVAVPPTIDPPLRESTTTDTVDTTTIDDLASGLDLDPYPSALTLEEAQRQAAQLSGTADVSGRRGIEEFQDRERFRALLRGRFEKLHRDGSQFLLVAMRVDPARGQVRPFDFEFLSSVVLDSLRDKDEAFVDLRNERLVLLFPDSNADDSQEFFSRVRTRLRKDAPQQATHLLNLVAAIVVPNGNPFSDADKFLSYVLDSE